MTEEDSYVASILQKYGLPASNPLAPSWIGRVVNPVVTRLQAWANPWLSSPISFSGSYAKGTGVAGTTDIDLFISLKADVPNTLEGIYANLVTLARNEGWNPRVQDVSVGVTYGGKKIDLVPARVQAGSLNYHSLYRRKAGTWTQTNVALHVATVRKSNRAPEIRAIKIWRMLHGLEFPSFFLELMVIDALAGSRVDTPARNVIKALNHIATNLPSRRIVDPANTNNIISDDLTLAEKRAIAAQAQRSAGAAKWGEIIW